MSAINGTTHTVEGERSTLRSSDNMKVVVKVPLIKGMHTVFTVSCSGTLQISKLIKLGTVGQQTASVSMTLVSMFWPRWLFKFADLEFMRMCMLAASVVSHRTYPCSLLSAISMFFCCKLISFSPSWNGIQTFSAAGGVCCSTTHVNFVPNLPDLLIEKVLLFVARFLNVDLLPRQILTSHSSADSISRFISNSLLSTLV